MERALPFKEGGIFGAITQNAETAVSSVSNTDSDIHYIYLQSGLPHESCHCLGYVGIQ
jgi:hypothetical protein